MPREEMLTEQEQRSLAIALQQIDELERLLRLRPIETFRELMKLKIPMELEIELKGGAYAVKLNESS